MKPSAASSRRAWALWVAQSTPSPARASPRKAASKPRRQAVTAVPATQTLPEVQIADVQVAPKPTMHHSDRWAKRPPVLRYRASCDELRLRGLRVPERYAFVFYLPMPASWTRTRRDAMRGTAHQSKPDATNLQKTVEDALCLRDEAMNDVRSIKRWSDHPRLVIVDTARRATPTEADLNAWLP